MHKMAANIKVSDNRLACRWPYSIPIS